MAIVIAVSRLKFCLKKKEERKPLKQEVRRDRDILGDPGADSEDEETAKTGGKLTLGLRGRDRGGRKGYVLGYKFLKYMKRGQGLFIVSFI